jgi:hypothetical protein
VPEGQSKYAKTGRLRAEGLRIGADAEWTAARARRNEIDGVFPCKKGKRGFEGKRRSYVDSHPSHLLSSALKCGPCGGAIARVSGKNTGYYGCLNASRRSCDSRKSSHANASKISSWPL